MTQTLTKTRKNKLLDRPFSGKAEPDPRSSMHSTDQGSSESMFGGTARRSRAGGGTDFLDHNKADKAGNWKIVYRIGYVAARDGLPKIVKKKKIRFKGSLEEAVEAAREHGLNLYNFTLHSPKSYNGPKVSCLWEIKEPGNRALVASGVITTAR